MVDRAALVGASDVDAELAPGYGKMSNALREAIAMAAGHEALLLDPGYAGKTVAGLIGTVRAGRIERRSRGLAELAGSPQ